MTTAYRSSLGAFGVLAALLSVPSCRPNGHAGEAAADGGAVVTMNALNPATTNATNAAPTATTRGPMPPLPDVVAPARLVDALPPAPPGFTAEPVGVAVDKGRDGVDFAKAERVYRAANGAVLLVDVLDLRGFRPYYPRGTPPGTKPFVTSPRFEPDKHAETVRGVVGRFVVMVRAQNAEPGLPMKVWATVPTDTLVALNP